MARPAQVELRVEGESEGKVRVVWGERVAVVCTASGHPEPSLQLGLLNSSEAEEQPEAGGPRVELSYSPTLQEAGARFVCRWRQEEAESGRTLYEGEEISVELDVVMAPSLLLEVETDLQYRPGLRISPQLMSRPVPQPSQVTWRLLTDNQTVLSLPEAGEAGLVDVLLTEVTTQARAPHEWRTELQLFNLTENLTAWLHVETEVGELDQMFQIRLPELSQLDGSDLVSMTQYQITSER